MTKETQNNNLENRVLVLMPTGRDASLVCDTLDKAYIYAESCADINEVTEKFAVGAGAILLAEESLKWEVFHHLSETFNSQPVWSDVPVVVFAGNAGNPERLLNFVGTTVNATIVERPIRIAMLVSAVRGALRAREKQYQTRDLLNKLAESDHQKDLFLATLSHELRTPLNSMLGWIQLLRNNSGAVDLRHGLEIIERNAKAQSEIVSDILFVSRIITGKLTFELKPVELVHALQGAIEVVLPSIEAKQIKLNTFFDPDIGQINGNHDRLKQIFWNILSNAVKFTPSYGHIEVSARVNNTNVEVEITDSGEGIDPEFLPFIFERFMQADSSYTRKVGGLGLGLAIVRHLIEMHGGSVGVNSDGVNCGTTFIIRIPVLDSKELSYRGEENHYSMFESNKKDELPEGINILLVEDNVDSREMLTFLFTRHNVKINAVGSAAEALAAINQSQPDILISDIGMPGEDGYALIRKVRQLSPENGGLIPAIALTGYASVQDRDLAIEAGYQEHSSKPVDVDKLLDLVKNVLSQNKINGNS